MNIELDFEIGNKVNIEPLKREGRIVSIWITQQGIKYEVRYFDNAELKIEYFYADELRPR